MFSINKIHKVSGFIDVRNNNNLIVGHETDFHEDDRDREILVGLTYYRIAKVNEAKQEIELREPYAGDDKDAVGFPIGVKFVGEPCLVQVPTILLFLSRRDDLISE